MKYQLPLLSPLQFATVMAALRTFAENPYYTPHFDGLGSERLVGFALRPKTIHKLADRINMKSTEVLPPTYPETRS